MRLTKRVREAMMRDAPAGATIERGPRETLALFWMDAEEVCPWYGKLLHDVTTDGEAWWCSCDAAKTKKILWESLFRGLDE